MAVLAFTLAASSARAENGLLPFVWNQIRSGQLCSRTSAEEVGRAGGGCFRQTADAPVTARRSASETFEWLAFQQAAAEQSGVNACLSERLAALRADENKLATWASYLAASWLGARKARLIRERCQALFWRGLEPADFNRGDLERAYDRSSSGRADRRSAEIPVAGDPDRARANDRAPLREMCLKDRVASGLRFADGMFGLAVPTFSSQEAFDAMGRHRDQIVRVSTGRPIADDELLQMDLSNLSDIRLGGAEAERKSMVEDLQGVLTRAEANRRRVNARLDGTRGPDGVYDLTSDARDLLFQEGGVQRTLQANGFLSMSPLGDVLEASPGAACVLARYEPTLVGELAEFGALAVFFEVGWTRAFAAAPRLAQTLTGAEGRAAASRATFGSLTAYGAVVAAGETCGSRLGAARRMRDGARSEFALAVRSGDLPASLGYQRWNLQFSAADAPSCVGGRMSNHAGDRARASCLEAVSFGGLSGMPWFAALPAAAAHIVLGAH